MKNIIICLFAIIVFVGCKERPDQGTREKESTVQTAGKKEEAESLDQGKSASMTNESDTLRFAGNTLTFVKIDKTEFLNSPVPENKPIKESDLLNIRENVTRNGDSLCFNLTNNKKTALVNNLSDADDYIRFELKDYNVIDNYWAVNTYYYEGYSVLLVNKNNGKIIEACNLPVKFNDSLYLAVNYDLEAGYDLNGLQFFSSDTSGNLTKVFEKEINDWGPREYRVDQNGDILVEKVFRNAQMELKTEYLKLHLTRNKRH